MEQKQKRNSFIGIGFTKILTLLFITLKLTGVITWSWFWVLSPILIPLIVLIALVIIAGIVAVIIDN